MGQDYLPPGLFCQSVAGRQTGQSYHMYFTKIYSGFVCVSFQCLFFYKLIWIVLHSLKRTDHAVHPVYNTAYCSVIKSNTSNTTVATTDNGHAGEQIFVVAVNIVAAE